MRLVMFKIRFLLVFILPLSLFSRSALRSGIVNDPLIITNWVGDDKKSFLRDSHLEVFPFFHTFDEEHIQKNLLPSSSISFRNEPNKSVNGKEISEMIEHLIGEVRRRKRKFRDFICLKKRDFCRRKQAGLIVVKCKKYPFVVKLFMETPKSFVRPYQKGFEPACQFTIGGGATRHLVGFTRIKNVISIKERIKNNHHWSKRIDVPRKWFWLPSRERRIKVTGKNIGGHKEISTNLPSVYAIVADEIKAERTFSLWKGNDRRIAIDLSNFLLCRIDPHITNFMVEKETGLVVIIDTEHFPSLVGLKTRPRITSYSSWYLRLVSKFMGNRFLRSKRDRKRLQTHPIPPFSLP